MSGAGSCQPLPSARVAGPPPHLDVLASLPNDHGQLHLPVHLLQGGKGQ